MVWLAMALFPLAGTAQTLPSLVPESPTPLVERLLAIDPANTYLVVEHEYPKARIQDKAKLAPILKGSLAFAKAIDEAAAAMYALQHEVLASQGIPVQGVGREAYRS